MTTYDNTELRQSVAALRDRTFDLISQMGTAAQTGELHLASAASQLQSAANRLGRIESMLTPGGVAA